MKDTIAERKLVLLSPSGEEIQSGVSIGRPFREKHCWCCPLEIEGVDKPRCGCGADSLQSVLLTVEIARNLLETLVKQGWKIRWPDSGNEVSPAEIFEAKECGKMTGEHCEPQE